MFSRVFLGPLKKIPRDILPTPEPRSYLLVETKRRQKSVAALTTASTHPPPFTLWWCCCPPGTDPQHRSRGQLDSSLPHTSHIIWSPWPYLLNISNHHPLLSSTSHSLRSSPLYISPSQPTSKRDIWSSLPRVPRAMVLNHTWDHINPCWGNMSWIPTANG